MARRGEHFEFSFSGDPSGFSLRLDEAGTFLVSTTVVPTYLIHRVCDFGGIHSGQFDNSQMSSIQFTLRFPVEKPGGGQPDERAR